MLPSPWVSPGSSLGKVGTTPITESSDAGLPRLSPLSFECFPAESGGQAEDRLHGFTQSLFWKSVARQLDVEKHLILVNAIASKVVHIQTREVAW